MASYTVPLTTSVFITLCNAAKYGFDEICEVLMEHGADPLIEDDSGRSAFDFAEAGGHELCYAVSPWFALRTADA